MKINPTDKWFSYFIRLRDSDENGYCTCCTCGLVRFWKYIDCGHWILRQYQATRYNEKNCNAQCKGCNKFQSGAETKHEAYIKNKYGQQTVDLLKSGKNSHFKRTKLELNILAQEYKEKSLELIKTKNIEL